MKLQRLIVMLFGIWIGISSSFNAFSQTKDAIKEGAKAPKVIVLPSLQHEKLREILNTSFGVKDFEKIEPLNGGFSNAKLYKILVKNKYYVLRLSENESQGLKDEIKCMILASRLGVAPKVYYANANDGITVMDYIQNKGLTKEEMSNPKTIIKLAEILHSLHNEKPSFPKLQHKTIIAFMLEHEKSVPWPDKPALVLEGIKKLEIINQKLAKLKVKKSSHNDLNPNNILYDGEKFWLIDWQSAGLSDPFFDLATISNFMIDKKEMEELYLKTYFKEKPSKIELDHYLVMKQASRCYYGLALMLIAKKLGSQPLTAEELQTLDLRNILDKLDNKTMSLTNPHDIELFGASLIKEGLNSMDSEEYQKSLSQL
jgi:hypothetical protein